MSAAWLVVHTMRIVGAWSEPQRCVLARGRVRNAEGYCSGPCALTGPTCRHDVCSNHIVLQAEVDELSLVSGLGEKKIQNLYAVFREPFIADASADVAEGEGDACPP